MEVSGKLWVIGQLSHHPCHCKTPFEHQSNLSNRKRSGRTNVLLSKWRHQVRGYLLHVQSLVSLWHGLWNVFFLINYRLTSTLLHICQHTLRCNCKLYIWISSAFGYFADQWNGTVLHMKIKKEEILSSVMKWEKNTIFHITSMGQIKNLRDSDCKWFSILT